jgi:NAD(P)H-hydrate epimerase
MKVTTAQEMREIDRITIEEYGVPGLVLMERAGLAVAARVKELFPGNSVLVLCGGGNNGGDGLVAARNLFNSGFKVRAVLLAPKESFSPDCAAQYATAKKWGVPVEFRKSLSEKDLHGAVIIDAVFGAGLGRPVQGEIARLFSFINGTDTAVLAVDIPSGISSDTGEALGEALEADYTVTFGLPKRGHFLYPGAAYTGKLFVEDIGFHINLLSSDALKVALLNRESMSGLLPSRRKNSYKGDYGHVLVVAGSQGKTGAALLTAEACLRAGAGLVTLGTPASLMAIVQARVTEAMSLPLPDTGKGVLLPEALDDILAFSGKCDVIAIGPGIGVAEGIEMLMTGLVLKSPVPLVIDADGLNALCSALGTGQRIRETLRNARSPLILTPHPGEMARLLSDTGQGIREIERDRIGVAVSFAKDTATYLVLKGVPTVVASPEGAVFINTSGNPGMATGGSGDVLTGIIAALLGQELEPIHAAALGVYVHGLAGDIAAGRLGMLSLIASDLIAALPETFR